jgi:hypothetical protein
MGYALSCSGNTTSAGFFQGVCMPTRYLKPGIRDSDLIDKLSPLAETLFYRLIVTVDDFGRFDARPSMIKSQCFPVKDAVTPKKCAELLEELAQVGVVMLYKVGEKPCLQLLKWDNKPRASASLYPAPDDTCIQTYADARNGHTNIPVTVTVTGTETKTGTETRNAPDGVSDSVWQDFKTLRAKLRAPITATSMAGIVREAERAGVTLEVALRTCCERGWRGFKADWMAEQKAGEPAWRTERAELVAKHFPNIAEKKHGITLDMD